MQVQTTLSQQHGSDRHTGKLAAFIRRIPGRLFTLIVIALLLYGWQHRTSNYITAETGVGYVLGIVGASLMLVLLLYPVSKRVAFFRRMIPLRYWFGFHMLLGIIGPLMILYHANFHLGSINSNVALFCMLLVAGSGLIGRYIYTHIHHGLYGTRISLNELKQELNSGHKELFDQELIGEQLAQKLNTIEQKTLQPYTGIISGLLHAIKLGMLNGSIKKQLTRQLKDSADYKQAKIASNEYMITLRRITAFKVYERLFALWHILHLPLFFMMIIAAVVHVFAVHLY